jgi:hypothetical protein
VIPCHLHQFLCHGNLSMSHIQFFSTLEYSYACNAFLCTTCLKTNGRYGYSIYSLFLCVSCNNSALGSMDIRFYPSRCIAYPFPLKDYEIYSTYWISHMRSQIFVVVTGFDSKTYGYRVLGMSVHNVKWLGFLNGMLYCYSYIVWALKIPYLV